jgi:hypothetical protein
METLSRPSCKAMVTTILLPLFTYTLTHFSYIHSSSYTIKPFLLTVFISVHVPPTIPACCTVPLPLACYTCHFSCLPHHNTQFSLCSLLFLDCFEDESIWLLWNTGTYLPIYITSYLKNKNFHQHHCKNLKILGKWCTSKGHYALCPAYFYVRLLREFLLCD